MHKRGSSANLALRFAVFEPGRNGSPDAAGIGREPVYEPKDTFSVFSHALRLPRLGL